MKNNLILTGFMGSGKSTLGIKLSYALRMALLDTDKWIEQKEKCTISQIFASQGEAHFRELETQYLKQLFDKKDSQVISVGGGLPVKAENRDLLKKLGFVVYLQASPQTIYERLKEDTTRPLLQTEDPYGRIVQLMQERECYYLEGATKVISVDGKTIAELEEEIKQAYLQFQMQRRETK